MALVLLIRVIFNGPSLWGRSLASLFLLAVAGQYIFWRITCTLNVYDYIALGLGLPPEEPVNPMVPIPVRFAVSMAWATFLALPDVLMPINTSPGLPSPLTNCA